MLPRKNPQQEFRAFCSTCPDPSDVTRVLAPLGFRLTFQMPAKGPATERIPAQFHYSRPGDRCEVIYLAGRDLPEAGERFPPHQSCFWAYRGADPTVVERVMCALAARWVLTWHPLPLNMAMRHGS